MDYKELEMMLCDEIDRIAERKELNSSSLDTLDKLSHTLKYIKTIEAMDGYSEDYMHDSMSYARRRDSRGRYANDRYNEGRYPGRY